MLGGILTEFRTRKLPNSKQAWEEQWGISGRTFLSKKSD